MDVVQAAHTTVDSSINANTNRQIIASFTLRLMVAFPLKVVYGKVVDGHD